MADNKSFLLLITNKTDSFQHTTHTGLNLQVSLGLEIRSALRQH